MLRTGAPNSCTAFCASLLFRGAAAGSLKSSSLGTCDRPASAGVMAPCSPRGAAAGAGQVSPAAQPVAPPPPNAKKVPHKMELFGDVRVDNYYWLRDDKRQDPDVLAYLAAENDYTTAQMAGT